jgi:hypothetical protein
MLDVVDLFREHDTRDELGVGSVRDAFADMLSQANCYGGTGFTGHRAVEVTFGAHQVAVE